MAFQDDQDRIQWRLRLQSPITKVYQTLATDSGRASFWAESAIEQNGIIHFVFPNNVSWQAQVLEAVPPTRFALRYYGDSVVVFALEEDGQGGTELLLTDSGVSRQFRTEVIAGWVSVLMALKGAVDFGVDLRNHDENRNWDQGYVEN